MDLYSYHVFLFPFEWLFVGKEMKDKTLEQRTCLKEFISLFKNTLWKQQPYKTDTILNYNEYNYFFSMVREVLFDEGKKDLERAIISNLIYDIPSDTHTYNFKVCTNGFKKTYKLYSLHIDSIILHLYSSGMGVLSFHLNNRLKEQSSPEDILNINQAGRRLYPPFFGIDHNIVGTKEQFNYNDFSFGLNIVQQKELAVEFSVISDLHFEDFSSYSNPENFQSNPFQIPKHISFLFKNIPLTVSKTDFKSIEKKIYISPLIDDRMFVVCWYGNDKISKELKEKVVKNGNETSELNYERNEWWYRYMFNDQAWISCQNKAMKENLIKNCTYERWSDFGTFYGVNRYSFVCLTGNLETLRKNNAAFIVNHMQTIYYKMIELCLVQRACILRFSEEVAGISAMKDNTKISLSERVGNLNKQYLSFVNRIYFREVTAQEQGIELYNMMQEQMKIDANVKDLNHEIQQLHSYVSLIQEQKQSRNIELLTIVGALFIIPSFITGFFDMSIFPGANNNPGFTILLFLIPFLLSPFVYYFIDKSRTRKWIFWLLIFVFGITLIIIGLYMIVFENYI